MSLARSPGYSPWAAGIVTSSPAAQAVGRRLPTAGTAPPGTWWLCRASSWPDHRGSRSLRQARHGWSAPAPSAYTASRSSCTGWEARGKRLADRVLGSPPVIGAPCRPPGFLALTWHYRIPTHYHRLPRRRSRTRWSLLNLAQQPRFPMKRSVLW